MALFCGLSWWLLRFLQVLCGVKCLVYGIFKSLELEKFTLVINLILLITLWLRFPKVVERQLFFSEPLCMGTWLSRKKAITEGLLRLTPTNLKRLKASSKDKSAIRYFLLIPQLRYHRRVVVNLYLIIFVPKYFFMTKQKTEIYGVYLGNISWCKSIFQYL